MTAILGPVSEAAHGAHSDPVFELCVGVGMFLLTWIPYFRRRDRSRASFWIAVGITAICSVFVVTGVAGFLHRT